MLHFRATLLSFLVITFLKWESKHWISSLLKCFTIVCFLVGSRKNILQEDLSWRISVIPNKIWRNENDAPKYDVGKKNKSFPMLNSWRHTATLLRQKKIRWLWNSDLLRQVWQTSRDLLSGKSNNSQESSSFSVSSHFKRHRGISGMN